MRRHELFSHHHPQHPYSRASCIILHYNYTSDPKSDTGRLLGSTPASRWYKVRPCRINTYEIAIYSGGGLWKAERGSWRSQGSMPDSSTTARLILDLLLGRRWARCQLHTGILYIPVALVPMEIAYPPDSGLLSLLILNSMADSSTTA